MTALELLADLRSKGVILTVKGDRLAYDAPAGTMTPDLLATIKAHKPAIVAALTTKPSEHTWREDSHGRLWFPDGIVYAPTITGGWILVKHPTKRMREPGIIEVTP